jgi:4'-phosphopantetheinyl transferase
VKKIDWQKPGSPIQLAVGEVHLWRANLNLSPLQVEVGRGLLSTDERERADRMVTQTLQNRRAAAQSILRDVLARYLAISPSRIVFSLGERGKPSVQGSDLEFNMSHTEDLALIALTRTHPIGVDIEFIKTSKYHESIVEKNYSPQEFAQYQSLPEGEKLEAFFRGWTRKEAYIKAIGLGLYYPLEKFTVDLASKEDRAMLSIEGSTERASTWFLPSFWADEKIIGAVAIEAEIKNWLFYDWKDFA